MRERRGRGREQRERRKEKREEAGGRRWEEATRLPTHYLPLLMQGLSCTKPMWASDPACAKSGAQKKSKLPPDFPTTCPEKLEAASPSLEILGTLALRALRALALRVPAHISGQALGGDQSPLGFTG